MFLNYNIIDFMGEYKTIILIGLTVFLCFRIVAFTCIYNLYEISKNINNLQIQSKKTNEELEIIKKQMASFLEMYKKNKDL